MYLVPHKRYVYLLFLRRLPFTTINEELVKIGLHPITEQFYKEVKSDLTELLPLYMADYKVVVAGVEIPMEVVDQMGIRELYAYKYDKRYFVSTDNDVEFYIDKALKTLSNPNNAVPLKVLAMAGIDIPEIELYVNSRRGTALDTRVFEYFFKYFFDVFDWTFEERKYYQKVEPNSDLKALYDHALDTTNMDINMLVWKLGFYPDVSMHEMLSNIFTESYYLFKTTKKRNPDQAQKWASTAMRLFGELKEMDNKQDTTLSMLEDIQLGMRSVNPNADIPVFDPDNDDDDESNVVAKPGLDTTKEIEIYNGDL